MITERMQKCILLTIDSASGEFGQASFDIVKSCIPEERDLPEETGGESRFARKLLLLFWILFPNNPAFHRWSQKAV